MAEYDEQASRELMKDHHLSKAMKARKFSLSVIGGMQGGLIGPMISPR